MTEPRLSPDDRAPAALAHAGAGADTSPVVLVELLFFAYRDFIGEPDRLLARYGFGRAHHRVLHFVNRNPGLTVAELLSILDITKQSLGRVLRDLVAGGLIEQRAGAEDRRQRLMYLTAAGMELAGDLLALQSARVRRAIEQVPPAHRAWVKVFLAGLLESDRLDDVARLTQTALDLDGAH